MRRALLPMMALAATAAWTPAGAQIAPGQTGIVINNTPVVGGTNGNCLTVNGLLVGQVVCGGAAAGITVGTSPIAGGATTRVLYDNAGVLGEYTVSGSGNVAMTTSPVFTTPNLGTPSAATLTNATGLPVAGLSNLGANVGTWLITPSSANLLSAMSDKTGTGVLVFGTSPTFTTGITIGAGSAITSSGAGGAIGTAAFQAYTATTWTPSITTDSTPGTPVYSAQVGSYEQIGRLVVVRFNIQLSNWTGSPTGNVLVGGLPVTAANTAGDYGSCYVGYYQASGLAALNYGLGGYIGPNSTQITIQQFSNTVSANVTAAQFGTAVRLIGACTYHT